MTTKTKTKTKRPAATKPSARGARTSAKDVRPRDSEHPRKRSSPKVPDAEIPLRLGTAPAGCRDHESFPMDLHREDGSRYMPLLEVAKPTEDACGRPVPAGHRAGLSAASVFPLGSSGFDYHTELPMNGFGIERNVLVVVEREQDGTIVRTPYVRWCREVDLKVRCSYCGADLLKDKPRRCSRG